MSQNPLLADNLSVMSGIRHAFFTREWGSGGFSGEKAPEETRATMESYLQIAPHHLLCCHQIHSPTVVTVDELWNAQGNPQADAMVTNKAGIALGILTADCVPVLFADSGAGVIGAAHAGWRGALGGVLENTVAAMEKLGARRKSIYAALGPCIWQNSYEVGPEFLSPFLAENPAHEKFFRFILNSDRYLFDLAGYVVAKLRDLGLGSIESSPADTCADPKRFFSHRYSTLRNEKRVGNLMSAITMGHL